jgi:hypothetical protein
MKTRAEPHKQPRPFFIRRSPGYPWRVALQQGSLPFTRPANFSYAQSQPMGRLITHHPFCPLAHMPPKNTIPFVHYSVFSTCTLVLPDALRFTRWNTT